jgi:hypothetical protein
MRGALLIAMILCWKVFAADSPLRLQPVYRLRPINDKQQFMTADDYDFSKRRTEIEGMAFRAVCTNSWPAGLVPVFAVEKTNRVELRRRPALGQENFSEPLFFALPPDHEAEAAKVAGRWECLGIRGTGSREIFGWDLAVEGENVAGRFDQFTDFRFGRIAGGSFRSNQLELRIEYIDAVYHVKGVWAAGKYKGDWTRADESENGTWEASRPVIPLPISTNTVLLYEWRRASDNARRYLVEGQAPGPSWQRHGNPLCRVWKAE